MQKKKWVRVGLAAVVLGGAFGGMTAAGCGGDDNNGTPPKEAGTDTSSRGTTAGTPEASAPRGVDTATRRSWPEAGPPNAKVYLVHAATDPLAPPAALLLRYQHRERRRRHGHRRRRIAPFPDYVTVPAFPIAGLLPGFGGSTAARPSSRASTSRR